MRPGEANIIPALVELLSATSGDRLNLLAHHCARLTWAAAVSVAEAGPDGSLRAGVAASQQADRLLRAELAAQEGPAIDCFREYRAIHGAPLLPKGRWRVVATAAQGLGLTTVDTLPIATDTGPCGVLILYSQLASGLGFTDNVIATALADVTGAAVTHARHLARVEHDCQELRDSLEQRVLVEQATGLIAGRDDIGMDSAHDRLFHLAHEQGMEPPAAAAAMITEHRAQQCPSRSGTE